MRDPQPEQQASQGPVPGPLDGLAQVANRRLPEAVPAGDPVVVQRVDPGYVGEEALAYEQVDPLFTEALDIHGPSGGEVLDPAPDLPGT